MWNPGLWMVSALGQPAGLQFPGLSCSVSSESLLTAPPHSHSGQAHWLGRHTDLAPVSAKSQLRIQGRNILLEVLRTLYPAVLTCSLSNTFVPSMSGNKHTSFTFFGEKFLGIFSCHNELARHLPQKFYDQCNVICMFQTFQEGGKRHT